MRLSLKAMAITAGLLWGGCLFLVGLMNLAFPQYGAAFLRGMASIYPGFYHTRSFVDVLVGTLYAVIDGAVAGCLFAWLYNGFAGPGKQTKSLRLNQQLSRAGL